MSGAKEVIVITESITQSLIRDVGTVASLVSLVGIGWLIDSTALQWVGAFLGIFAIFGRAMRVDKQFTYTIAEARQRLDEIEAGK